MTGHLIKGAENINQVLWADAELESINITYDCLSIKLQESNGQMKLISCFGYINYESIGVWDEIVIAKATIHSSHELIDKNINSINKRLGDSMPDSGCNDRNNRFWNLLQIRFIDDSELNIIMDRVSVIALDE